MRQLLAMVGQRSCHAKLQRIRGHSIGVAQIINQTIRLDSKNDFLERNAAFNFQQLVLFVAPGTNAEATAMAGTVADKSMSFIYGPEHQRIKQVSVGGPAAGTVWYMNGEDSLGLAYEKELKATGVTEHKHYLSAGGITFAMFTSRVSTASGTTTGLPAGLAPTAISYFNHDHLGSIVAITDDVGAVVERLAFDAWGKRRFTNGTADTLDAISGQITHRGYTMHEHLEDMGIIHMNGRIYDPLIGRFMSADPYLQAPSDLQSYNRYSYVRNNPMNLTDPSGYSWWTKLRDKVIKPIIAGVLDAMGCGGFCTMALNAYNASQMRDANGNRLGWKGALLGAAVSWAGGLSDSIVYQAGIQALGACGMSSLAGGSCRRGALESLTNSAFGPVLGGCINASRAGGSCAAGARDGAVDMAANWAVQNGTKAATNYINEAKPKNDWGSPVSNDAQNGGGGNGGIQLACACNDFALSDRDKSMLFNGDRAPVVPRQVPKFELTIPFSIQNVIDGWQWIMSVAGGDAASLPSDLVGDQSSDLAGLTKNGKRHTSGPLTPDNGGTGDASKDFDRLTGGSSRPAGGTYPPGALVGPNGVVLRPGKNGGGSRIEIPRNGNKPPETLHY